MKAKILALRGELIFLSGKRHVYDHIRKTYNFSPHWLDKMRSITHLTDNVVSLMKDYR